MSKEVNYVNHQEGRKEYIWNAIQASVPATTKVLHYQDGECALYLDGAFTKAQSSNGLQFDLGESAFSF